MATTHPNPLVSQDRRPYRNGDGSVSIEKQPKQRESSSSNLSHPMLGQLEDSTHETFCQTLFRWPVCSLLIYLWLLVYCVMSPALLAPILGKSYFDDHGGNGAASYALYYGIFSSIGGFVGFSVQGLLGQLSDLYGRKPLLLFTCITVISSQLCFNFSYNIWYWFVFIPVMQLAGTFGGINGILLSAFADLVNIQHRTVFYGFMYGTVGAMLVISALMVTFIESKYGMRMVIYSYDIVSAIAFLWNIFVIQETLSSEIRERNKLEYSFKREQTRQYILDNNISLCKRICTCLIEPFKVLLRIRENKIVFWMAILCFFTSLPECGLQDLLTAYLLYTLNDKYFDDDKSKETQFNSISFVLLGMSMLISQLIFLPIMNKIFHNNDIILIIISLFVLLFFCLLGIYIYFDTNIMIGYLLKTVFGFSLIVSPITTSALSKRLNEKEQGLGMGIVQAMKGLTYTFGPVLFSIIFDICQNYGFLVTMPFIFAFLFFASAIPIVLYPIRRVLNKYDEMKLKEHKNGNISPLHEADDCSVTFSEGQ